MISKNSVMVGGQIYGIKKIETKTGKTMASFTVRVFKRTKDKDLINFVNFICYSGTADLILDYGYDGREVFIEGEFSSYKDKDGKDHLNVIANSVQLLGEKIAV